MCVANEDEWLGGDSGGYAGSPDMVVVEAPTIYIDPDLYAGVDWEEIHPPLIESLGTSLADLGIDLADLDLDLADLPLV